MRWAILLFCSIVLTVIGATTMLQAQQLEDPMLLWDRVRDRLVRDLQNLVRHVCVQTITRTYRRPNVQSLVPRPCTTVVSERASRGEQPIQWWDRWRLDVAIAGREIYSWPGAAQFSDGKITDFINYGAVLNGDFGPLIAGAIFGSARTVYKDERVIDGRKLWEYTYEVPSFRSTYTFETDSGEITVAYDGTILIDPASSDLVRLTARSAVLPGGRSAECQAISTVYYERIRMGQRDVLIPRKTEVHMIDQVAGETLIATSYANCRQYFGESVIKFDEPAEESKKSEPLRRAVPTLPAGLPFECRLITAFDWDNAAGGDAIQAALRSPITGSDGKVIVPMGAQIKGRLTRVFRSGGLLEIRIRFESIEINGRSIPFSATETPGGAVRFARAAGTSVPEIPEGTGVFLFREKNLRVRQIDSEWITAAPKQ
jgi:hypothetical protein